MARTASLIRKPEEVLIDTLKKAITDGVLKELVNEVKAPCKMQARRANGEYRTATVTGGEEFMFSGARMHKTGTKIIFEFKPVDPSGDFDQYELDDTKIFAAFPETESLVVRALGFDDIDTDDNCVPFAAIKGTFLRQVEELEEARALEEEKAEKAEAAGHYDEHPLYGVWG
ncbi:hypothetical protein IVB12_15565 [Bradyrhizobium sp. 179]|uniref:hypothetical protein n=1 Tax=Bradyrhizobium sp. 179 TaxID=2782648 RepID=UPI001FFA244C|nr:hypothetical protein [Bradyrhizobium sp. 179]MCK1543333.1 hypothetical protein [Bradyrhizobium sp. 179]